MPITAKLKLYHDISVKRTEEIRTVAKNILSLGIFKHM